MNNDTAARKAALLARTSTRVLLQSVATLDAKKDLSQEERLSLAWLCDAVTDRLPEVDAAMNAWVDDDVQVGAESYAAALVRICREHGIA